MVERVLPPLVPAGPAVEAAAGEASRVRMRATTEDCRLNLPSASDCTFRVLVRGSKASKDFY